MSKNTTDRTIFVPLISDGPNTGFKAVPNPDYVDPNPLPPSYTLKEIEALAREFLREKEINADDSITALALSRFGVWLARREREGRG